MNTPRGHRTKSELAAKRLAADAATRHEPGYPPRPTGLSSSVRKLWNEYAGFLHGQRLLATDDGAMLLELVNAKQVGDHATMQQIVDTFMARTPFPKPEHQFSLAETQAYLRERDEQDFLLHPITPEQQAELDEFNAWDATRFIEFCTHTLAHHDPLECLTHVEA